MGMFDDYEPDPPIACDGCGGELSGWQSKDGPCALLVWREGAASPLRQWADPDCRLPPEALTTLRLESDVELYTTCESCGAPAEATGFLVDGVWQGTVRGHHAGEAPVPATIITGHWRQCSACADAWEEPARPLAECPHCRTVTRLAECSPRPPS
ncbi:MAG: hypothetical protein RLP09_48170 [Sandaracinaceae bacterium]